MIFAISTSVIILTVVGVLVGVAMAILCIDDRLDPLPGGEEEEDYLQVPLAIMFISF